MKYTHFEDIISQERKKAYNGLMRTHTYSHSKLLSELEFGVWKFMFNNV
jgi:hypothetical protein